MPSKRERSATRTSRTNITCASPGGWRGATSREEALRRLSNGIRRIGAEAGRPHAYHETITRAWFELVADVDNPSSHPELFDRTLLGRYYTRTRLSEGRERWLEPDLHPLRLPPPAPEPAQPAGGRA